MTVVAESSFDGRAASELPVEGNYNHSLEDIVIVVVSDKVSWVMIAVPPAEYPKQVCCVREVDRNGYSMKFPEIAIGRKYW